MRAVSTMTHVVLMPEEKGCRTDAAIVHLYVPYHNMVVYGMLHSVAKGVRCVLNCTIHHTVL